MMANNTKKELRAVAGDLCNLANQRFGLSKGMMMLMEGSMISAPNRLQIVLLAKNREFEKLEDLLSQVINKPHE